MYLFLDLETSGFDPQANQILEVAAQITTHAAPFTAVATYHGVLRLRPEELAPHIIDMHSRNGLLSECESSRLDITEAEDALLAMMNAYDDDDDHGAILAGCSPHFDRDFLRVHTPRFDRALSHQHHDVSSILRFHRHLGMPRTPYQSIHRALPDVHDTIDALRASAEWVTARRSGPITRALRACRRGIAACSRAFSRA